MIARSPREAWRARFSPGRRPGSGRCGRRRLTRFTRPEAPNGGRCARWTNRAHQAEGLEGHSRGQRSTQSTAAGGSKVASAPLFSLLLLRAGTLRRTPAGRAICSCLPEMDMKMGIGDEELCSRRFRRGALTSMRTDRPAGVREPAGRGDAQEAPATVPVHPGQPTAERARHGGRMCSARRVNPLRFSNASTLPATSRIG